MRPSELEPARWRRIDEIFEVVLETPVSDRERVLAETCTGDRMLRAEVKALLAATAEDTILFDKRASQLAAEILQSPDSSAAPGQIGPFRIVREIGRGGMGVVFLAEDARLGRLVALKALPPYLGVGKEAKRRFEAEARAVSALDHPNIATLHTIDETADGQLYMVFAYYEGETLEDRIARGPLPVQQCVEITIHIASGLGAAHRSGIVHRDVKPSNVLLTEPGGIKLLDFGVAKVAGETRTQEGVRLGTIAYMSPEAINAGQVDARADLWSLGVVFYEALTGIRPFRADDAASTLQRVVSHEPEPPQALRDDVPDAVARIVEKLLSKGPDSRYDSTDDLIADLVAVRDGRMPEVALRDPPRRGRDRIERLAVLPLANLTGDPEQRHLVNGVHDALIAELGRIHAIDVVSRTSVMRFHDTDVPIPEIAETLQVDAVLEGSVARDGDTLAITTQLIAPAPERQLWASTHRRGVGDVLNVAGQVARSVAAEIAVSLSPAEERGLTRARDVSPGAYEAFTLGQFHLERRSPEGLEQAQKYLKRAIEIDPGFAPAYAILAEAIGSAAFFGLARPTESLPVVRSLVQTALALDASLAAAHTSLGAVRLFGDWDAPAAEQALRKAIALNSSYPYAYFLLSEVLSVLGCHKEALAAAERNGQLEMFVPFSAFGPVKVLYYNRDFDAAIRKAEAGIEFFTDFWQGHWLLGMSLHGKGLYEQAIPAFETAVQTSHRTPLALGTLGSALARAGRRDEAGALLAQLRAMAASVYVGSSNLALIHTALGDYDSAFAALNRAYAERDMALVELAVNPMFDDLHEDPRFAAMLHDIGLADTPQGSCSPLDPASR